MQSELTERAKTAWNSIADEFNQWDALGLDEQETYVALTAALVDVPAVEPVKWPNRCNESAVEALRYLSEHDRPIGGEETFNRAHLLQIADEIERMASRPLYTSPSLSREGEDSAEVERLREAARRIVPYLQWTISDESPGYHPTMRSAVGAFMGAFGWPTEEAWQEDMRSAPSSCNALDKERGG